MRSSDNQAYNLSSFQRTPSYRTATDQNKAAHVGGARTSIQYDVGEKQTFHVHGASTIDHGDAPSTISDPTSNRRSSFSGSTSIDLAKVTSSGAIWNVTVPSVSSSVTVPASVGSDITVQRRGSYCDAMTPNTAKITKRGAIINKFSHGLKSLTASFMHSDPVGHPMGEKNHLIIERDPKYMRRWVSIWLTWIIMFIVVLQFSMYSSTLGTYLPLIDPTATEDFAPWAIAAFGFGQTFACPVFGWWSNRIRNNRLPMAVGLLLMIIGNIAYCFVEVFPADKRKWLVFGFRVFIGIGGGIAGVVRAYCATAARPHEYMKAVTGATAGLSLAIMAGPGAQAIFAPIGYPGVSLGLIRLHMYNAPALASIFIGILCIVLLYTVLLQEYPGLAKDEKKDRFFVLPKYDVCAAWVVIFCWFAAYLTLTSFVMIGKQYTMVMFHWSYVESVVDNGIIMGVFAFISLIIFIVYAYHGKKFDERFLMYVGISMMCAFFVITFPWPGLPRLQQECGSLPCCNPTIPLNNQPPCVDVRWVNKTNLMSISGAVERSAGITTKYRHDQYSTKMPEHGETQDSGHNDNFPGGCQAVKYAWCDYMTREPIGLYMGTFFLLAAGFPLANCAFSSLFSKIIGPRRQGFMQGVIISGGAAARTSGPIFINFTFEWWGPRISWGLTAAILVASIALSAAYFRRLIPLNPKPKLNPGEYFRYKNGVLYRF